MKLDDFDASDVDVEDQRGGGGGGGGGLIPGLGGGRIGLGTLVVVLLFSAVFKVNPLSLLGAMPATTTQPSRPATAAGGDAMASCNANAESHEACAALASLNKTWAAQFSEGFRRPHLVFYSAEGNSGCGAAQSAMGPFYCPGDQGIYLDTDFYRQLADQLGAQGQFARDYVIAHEYGHHLQNLLGTSGRVQQLQDSDPAQANPLSVRLELQADCYAGVWAALNRERMEPGDMESGLNAAHQIGDDTLAQAAGRNPVEAAFTHGSSAQRMAWLRKGLESADLKACDTFGGGQ
ncbi:MAG: neutral zinc metallopeptidase [Proteobacteria bacterium]|nr:neutral zinc metallopeptidase [Pseudomonadota bacterium]